MALSYHPTEIEEKRPAAADRLTVEHLAYGLILLLAGVMRLATLENIPLSPAEAVEALAVWDFWQPDGAAITINSAAYFSFTGLLSQFLGFSDHVMRLAPALFSLALVPLPWLLRHRLGRLGALTAALLLAVSASQTMAGRTAGGQAISLWAGMLLFIAWIRYQESNHPSWLYILAGSLGLGLASGPLFFGLLLTLIVAWMAQSIVGPALFPGDDPQSGLNRPLYRPNNEQRRQALLTGSAVFLAAATLFLWNLGGLDGVSRSLAEWFSWFNAGGDLMTWISPILALGRYEMILLLVGGVAVVWSTWHGYRFASLLLYWLVAGLLLLLLQRGQVGNILLLTLPGYLLIGRYISTLFAGAASAHRWSLAAILIFAGGVIYINLTRYSRITQFEAPQTELYHLVLIFLALIISLTISFFVWNWHRATAIQGTMLGIMTVLLIFNWGISWHFTQYAAHDTRERRVNAASDDELPLLAQTIREVSLQTTNSDDGLEILATVDSPALRWYLRDFENLEMGAALPRAVDHAAIITPLTADGAAPALESSYIGADFGHLRPDTEQLLVFQDALRWWFFRQSPVSINEERVIFWLRADLAGESLP